MNQSHRCIQLLSDTIVILLMYAILVTLWGWILLELGRTATS